MIRWVIVTVVAALAGAGSVQYLVAHPLRMDLYISLTLAALFIVLLVLARRFSGAARAAAAVVAFVAFTAGWAVMTNQVMSRNDYRPMPELTRAKGDPGDGHTAVIYLTHGEPSVYDPISWINQMNEFDKQGLQFVPFMARPVFFYLLRRSYLRVGKSDHQIRHQEMFRSLQAAYREAGDDETRFYLAFLDDNPRAGAAFIRALNDGASRIVVGHVFVTVSSHTAEGEHQIMEMDPDTYGVEVTFTEPLWNSELMHRMYVERVNANLGGSDKADVGVLLVAHGQPDEWDETWPLQTEHEMLFGDRIIELLIAEGYSPENVGKAWMSFKEPKPATEAERIYANGVDKLFFFSYTIAAAGMHSQYDIPNLVYKAAVPDDFPIIDLGAWGNDPTAIAAIKEKIDARLLSKRAATRRVGQDKTIELPL